MRVNPYCSSCQNVEDDSTEGSQFERITLQQEPKPHLFGGFKIVYLLWFFIPLLVGTCLYSYHMAVSQKQEKPFPAATITATACHYPQDETFRFFMLSAGGFINLIYFTVFRWLRLVKRQTQFPYSTENWLHPWAHLSVIGFYCAIATIDGKGTTSIHGPGAVFFFVFLFIVLGAVTTVLGEMKKWCSTVISSRSNLIKHVLFAYLIGVTIYCLVGLALEKEETNHDDPYLVIIEWNLTLTGLVWLFFFVMDWGNIFVVLRGAISDSIKRIEPES